MRYFFFITLFCIRCSCLEGFWGSAAPSNSEDVLREIVSQADIEIDGKRAWDLKVRNEAFYDRVLSEGSLGMGESYVNGWWDSDQLDQTIYFILRSHLDQKVTPTWGMRLAYLRAKWFNMQNKRRAKEVIDTHYQLGNTLFSLMLDPTMTYSCGYWKEANTLEEAQVAKLDLICRKLHLKPGMRILDIGCGWGGLVKHAAENYGVECVGVTLSENQALYARKVCQGLPVEILVQDWRDIQGEYDRVVSVGMFEHVGQKNYRPFMELARSCLKDEGLFLLHTIGSDTSVMTTDPWVAKYIFPNGQLPSITQIGESMEGLFVMEDWHNFGVDYGTTLMHWQENFARNWKQIEGEYPDHFYRMWNYYLLSCAGGFRARQMQLWQIVLSKEGVSGGYASLR